MESKSSNNYQAIIDQSLQIYLNLRDCSNKNSIENFSHRLDHLQQIISLCAEINNDKLKKFANEQLIIEKQRLKKIHDPIISSEIIAVVLEQNNMVNQAKKILEN